MYFSFVSRLVLATACGFVGAGSPKALAASPQDDFVEWYRGWVKQIENLPLRRVTEFMAVPEVDYAGSKAVFECLDSEGFRLRIAYDETTGEEVRFIENPKYCASVRRAGNSSKLWTVADFADVADPKFAAKSSDTCSVAGDIGFLAAFGTEPDPFVRSHKVSQSGHELRFEFDGDGQGRDLKSLRIRLDPRMLMPTTVYAVDSENNKFRFEIEGWDERQGAWLYGTLTTFVKIASASAMVKTEVSTVTLSGSILNDDHCWLSNYGLPEPGSRGGKFIALFLVCVVLLVLAKKLRVSGGT